MKHPEFTRVPTLSNIADGVREAAGSATVAQCFAAQGLHEEHVLAPDASIPIRDLMGLLERFARARGDFLFGVFAARTMRPEMFGPFVTYGLQGRNLRDALRRSARALRLHQGGSAFSLTTEGDKAVLSFRFLLPFTVGRHHHAVQALCQTRQFLVGFLGFVPSLNEVRLEADSYGRPGSLEEAMGAPIRWSQPTNSLIFPAALLESRPRDPANPATYLTLQEMLRYARRRPPTTDLEKTVAAVRLYLERGDTSIETVAQYLNLGPRSLQRRLQVEGLTYREVLDKVLHSRADELLASGRFAINQIAAGLGYSDPSHFTRAYRRWTGHPPNAVWSNADAAGPAYSRAP